MHKLILLYNFLIVSLFLVTGLIGAKSINHLIFALMFLPLSLFFFRRLFAPRPGTVFPATPGNPAYPDQLSLNSGVEAEIAVGEELSASQVSDLNRRLFLKLIGTAGLTTFLFALFTKSSHAAFFGSMPGPGTVALKNTQGNQIDPAEKQPTDGYEIAQVDDATTPSYYGFVDQDGRWYIAKEGSSGDYRYIRGSSDFPTSWSGRAGLVYDYFNNIF